MNITKSPNTKTTAVLKRAAKAGLVGLIPLTMAACSTLAGGTAPNGTKPPATTAPAPAGRPGVPKAKQTPSPAGTQPASTTGSSPGCSLGVIESIAGESSAEDQARTSSWAIQQAGGWTAFTPGGDWHLSASSQGLDVGSPEGGSDASVASFPSDSPWTYSSLGAQILNQVSDIHVICTSPNEQSSTGETQATELTGVYQGEQIHAIVVLSILAETTPGFFDGQTRSIYTPISDWNAANESTLFLIIKRAILDPSAP